MRSLFCMLAVLVIMLGNIPSALAAEVVLWNNQFYFQEYAGAPVYVNPVGEGFIAQTTVAPVQAQDISGNADGACVMQTNRVRCTWGTFPLRRAYYSLDVIGHGVLLQENGGYFYIAHSWWRTYVGRFEQVDTAERLFAPAWGCGVTMPGAVACFDEFGSLVPSPAMADITQVDVGSSANIDAIAYRRTTGEIEVYNRVTGQWWQDLFADLEAIDVATDNGIVCASGWNRLTSESEVQCYNLSFGTMLGNYWPYQGANAPQIWVLENWLVTAEGGTVEVFEL